MSSSSLSSLSWITTGLSTGGGRKTTGTPELLDFADSTGGGRKTSGTPELLDFGVVVCLSTKDDGTPELGLAGAVVNFSGGRGMARISTASSNPSRRSGGLSGERSGRFCGGPRGGDIEAARFSVRRRGGGGAVGSGSGCSFCLFDGIFFDVSSKTTVDDDDVRGRVAVFLVAAHVRLLAQLNAGFVAARWRPQTCTR